MSAHEHRSAGEFKRRMAIALILALLCGGACVGQGSGAGQRGGAPAAAEVTPAAVAQRVPLDSVVAIVNGDLILESDLDAERRMMAFQPYRDQTAATREQLIDRLIDRDLMLQQMKLQPEPPITDAQVATELAALRKGIPECATYHCDTNAGWEKFAADQGFTLDELRERWRRRMEVLQFIEQRFRMGIRIAQPTIDDYYIKTLTPAYQKQNAPPPAEASVADKIQEILLQQQVNNLLDEWLKALRAQGSVRMLEPGEVKP
jgi:peptidyl-prolyl cis-trans isomerase SurA